MRRMSRTVLPQGWAGPDPEVTVLADRLPRMEYVAIAISLAALVISLLARRDTKRQADAAVRDVALAELQREEDQTAKRSADVSAHVSRPRTRGR